jgi:hypothetical protein
MKKILLAGWLPNWLSNPALLSWVALVITVTFLSGLVYIIEQQNLRQSANDPQIQLAEDAASSLAAGKSPQAVLPGGAIDMATSLAPYLIIYDNSGTPLAASVELDGALPAVPAGVFSDAGSQGQKRFTWQPESGVRSAVVLTRYTGKTSGYVLAGRSLREVEKREDRLLWLVGLAWLGTCGLITLIFGIPFALRYIDAKATQANG